MIKIWTSKVYGNYQGGETVWYCYCVHDTMCLSTCIELCSAKNESQCTQINASHLGNQSVPGWNVDCKKRIKLYYKCMKKKKNSLRDSEGKM